jgi:hypothetical protein
MQTLIEDANNPYGVHASLWRWNPRTDGADFARFLDASGLPISAQDQLRSFTPRVLGQGAPPTEDGVSTGLVIGKVQSGKTNSFLALSALASDNGYRIIILLSGTKNILKSQTYRQVVNKLSRGARGWRAFNFEPAVDEADFETTLRIALSAISPKTLVIPILKRTRADVASSEGIDRLATLLERSALRDQLRRQPVLIVDDEADEASLDNSANARRAGRARRSTPTFEAIRRLRGLFDRHVFIQYTATPQANLLAELSDQLSPDFCELLRPGDGYCGAEEFFPPEPRYWREIPPDDVAAIANRSDTPPASLVAACRLFYVGCAVEDALNPDAGEQTRSMLVHPERQMPSHRLAQAWVQALRNRYLSVVEAAIGDPEGLLAGELYTEIDESLRELSRTVSVEGIRPGDLLFRLYERLQDTQIRLINSQSQLTEDVDWDDTLCWIFVGGDVLQRGFAFQGLTITWLARAPGTGQVDVLMQRGRFFGYRRAYLGFCRVWLPEVLHDDYYALFADHEKALWRSLERHLSDGLPMTSWSRVFWLDPNLRLCRRTSQWFRLRDQPEWSSQLSVPPREDGAAIRAAARNKQLLDTLRDGTSDWRTGWVPPNGELARSHRYTLIRVEDLEKLAEQYTFFGPDIVDHAVFQDALATLKENDADAVGVLVDMRSGSGTRRSVSGGRMSQLMQGQSKVDDPSHPSYYPGDREFRAGGEGLPDLGEFITIQIHEPALISSGEVITTTGGYLESGCPLLTVWLPPDVRMYRRQTT